MPAMNNISIRHPAVSAALANHRDAHQSALEALTPPGSTAGVPADVIASISQLLARGRQIHQHAVGIGQLGESANKALEATDENNGRKFGGSSE